MALVTFQCSVKASNHTMFFNTLTIIHRSGRLVKKRMVGSINHVNDPSVGDP